MNFLSVVALDLSSIHPACNAPKFKHLENGWILGFLSGQELPSLVLKFCFNFAQQLLVSMFNELLDVIVCWWKKWNMWRSSEHPVVELFFFFYLIFSAMFEGFNCAAIWYGRNETNKIKWSHIFVSLYISYNSNFFSRFTDLNSHRKLVIWRASHTALRKNLKPHYFSFYRKIQFRGVRRYTHPSKFKLHGCNNR